MKNSHFKGTNCKLKKFKDLFNIDVDAGILNSDIEKIYINKSKESIKMMLFSCGVISDDSIEECKKKLFDLHTTFKNIDIEFKKSESIMASVSDADIKKSIIDLCKESVVLKKIFEKPEVPISNNDLSVLVPHGAKKLLLEKHFERKIILLISDKMGKKVNINISELEANVSDKKVEEIVPEVKKTDDKAKKRDDNIPQANAKQIEIRDKDNPLPSINIDTASTIYGNVIKINPISIREVSPQENFATVWGDVFYIDSHETKDSKSIIYSIYITDYTNSIIVKIIENKNKISYVEKIKIGTTLLVQGEISDDKYDHEIVIRPKHINTVLKNQIVDNAEKKRVELHLHTNMSAMDGMTPASKIIETVHSWGHTAVAITDHGVAQAYPEAMNTANSINKNGGDIKIIYGVEAYFVNDMLPIVTGDEERDLDDEYICFDLETTGLNANFDKIIEIGAIRVKGNEILDEFCTFVNPKTSISANTTELTGITDDMVENAPCEEEAIKKFIEFCGKNPVLVAHNANFDTSFVKSACKRLKIDFNFTYVDTVPISRALIMSVKNHKLDTVAKYLKIPEFNHHRASDDARALAYIFIKLMKMAKDLHEISSLQQLNTSLSSSDPKKAVSHHMTILVKNQVGLKNLYRLISMAHLNYFYKKPRIPKSELLKYREGLIIGSACEAGELFRAITGGRPYEDILEIAKFYDYLEIQPLGNNAFMIRDGIAKSVEQLKEFNKKIVEIGEKLNIPVVATGDGHFLNPED